jgi:hypothetical protein
MSLEIIGTGLARTGTMSLKVALEHLTGDKCFHMIELLKNPKRVEIIKKGYESNQFDWDKFFEGYSSAVDYPTCLYYKELLNQNPNAKVIHTVRDFDSWYESVKQTVYRGKPKKAVDFMRIIKNMLFSSEYRKVAPVFMFNDKLIWQGHFESKFEDKEFMRKKYKDHEEEVKNTVDKERLLMYDVKEGWEPLCNFLGKNIPKIAFPRANQRMEFNQKMDKLLINGKFVE